MSWSDGVKKSMPSASCVATRSSRVTSESGLSMRVDVEVAGDEAGVSMTRAICALDGVVAPAVIVTSAA